MNQGRRAFSEEEREHLVRLYDGNLAFADQEVGALVKALASEGLLEKTVVIIAADHGEELLEHGWIGHNVQVYEPTVRVPLIVRFPKGAGPAGQRVTALSDLLDVAPTIADIFGVRGKGGSDREFQGRSLLPVLLGAPGKPALLSRSVWDRPRYALRDERFKYLYDTRTGEEQLYDLTVDPGEARDVAEEVPLRAAYYRQALHAWTLRLARHGPSTRRRCRADLRAVREPPIARLHPGRLLEVLQVAGGASGPSERWCGPRSAKAGEPLPQSFLHFAAPFGSSAPARREPWVRAYAWVSSAPK